MAIQLTHFCSCLLIRSKNNIFYLEIGHKKKRAREKETREGRLRAPSPFACLPRARPFSLSPTTSKRLLRRLVPVTFWARKQKFKSKSKNKNAGASQKTTAFCFVNCQFYHVICKSPVIISTFEKWAPDFKISMAWYSLYFTRTL